MRKIVCIAVMALLGFGNVNAQEFKYGIIAGFHNLSISASDEGITVSADGQGIYAGVFGEYNLSENLNLHTEFQYASASKDGESTNLLVLPILVKYYVSEQFNIQAGPQLDYITSEVEDANDFGVGIGVGAGFDISKNFFINTRYTFGLSNRLSELPSGVSIKFNIFQAGLGYRF